jgi:hypothetical protein
MRLGGGDSQLFILVMAALALVLVGTFVLRPSARGALGARVLFYAVRLGVVLVMLVFGSRHPIRGGAGPGAGGTGGTDPFEASDPFADSATSSSSSSSASDGGPKVMEFNWSTTKPSP